MMRKSPVIGAQLSELFSPLTSVDFPGKGASQSRLDEVEPFAHITHKRFVLIKIGRKYGMRTKRYCEASTLTSALLQYKTFDGKKESGVVDLYQTSCFVVKSDELLFGRYCLRIRRPDLKNPYRVYLRTPKQLEEMLRFCKLCSNRDLERFMKDIKITSDGSFFSVQDNTQNIRPFETITAPHAPRHSKSNASSSF